MVKNCGRQGQEVTSTSGMCLACIVRRVKHRRRHVAPFHAKGPRHTAYHPGHVAHLVKRATDPLVSSRNGRRRESHICNQTQACLSPGLGAYYCYGTGMAAAVLALPAKQATHAGSWDAPAYSPAPMPGVHVRPPTPSAHAGLSYPAVGAPQ